ncbi:MAG: response regulator [Desulfobacterales bacterium]|nr:response regulator [Desulfobacterales bacterium]
MNNAKANILIVDDEKTYIDLLAGILSDKYNIAIAKNGEQALKRLQSGNLPDLILLDIMMPGMSGYDVCEKLKADEKKHNIPIIFITAMDEVVDEVKAFKFGAVDYITKPFNSITVSARVRTHISLKQHQDNLADLVAERTAELNQVLSDLKVAKEKADAANQAKSDFLMNMSHELRTPLNGVLSASELITTSDTAEELEELQNIIQSSSHALLQNVETILDFTRSKDDALELIEQPFQLHEVLSKMKTQFFHKGVYINISLSFENFDHDIPNFIIGDAHRLNEIINYILENVAKFTDNDPNAQLAVKVTEKTETHVKLKFAITDKGIGISQQNLTSVFEPFSQVDTSSTRQYDGVGIGLSVCKQLVALMDGKIWVESESGKGSTFYFTALFKRQANEQPLDIQQLKAKIQPETFDSNLSIEALVMDISIVESILKKLNQALLESDPSNIRNCLSELKKYQIVKKSGLIPAVDDYEYEEAISILKKIAAEIGVQIE